MNAAAYDEERSAEVGAEGPEAEAAEVDPYAQARQGREGQRRQAAELREASRPAAHSGGGDEQATPDGGSSPTSPGGPAGGGDAQSVDQASGGPVDGAAVGGTAAGQGAGDAEGHAAGTPTTEQATGGSEGGAAAAGDTGGQAAASGAEGGEAEAPGHEASGAGGDAATPATTPGVEGAGPQATGGGGGAGGGGGGAGGGGGGGAGGGGAVEIQMPEAPDALSGEAQGRLDAAGQDMGAASQAAQALPAGEQTAGDARGAVTEPADETAGRAEVALTQALDDRPSPSAEILELCERIRKAIRDKRPPDEDSLVNADPEAMAKAAGDTLQADVQGDAQRVQGEYTDMDSVAPGQPSQTPTAYETPSPEVAADGGDATQATPDPIPDEDFSLEADVSEQAQAMQDAGMETEAALLVEDGPIGEARGAQGELEEAAASNPAELAARQAQAIQSAEADMATLQAQALAALQTSRAATVGASGGRQGQMVGTEEQMRAQAGQKMRQIFTDAKTQVTTLLEPLSTNAMAKWDAGVAKFAAQFKSSLKRVDELIEERHSGMLGGLTAMWDGLTGLPDEIVGLYDAAEKTFGDDVCALIMQISEEVNGVIAACEAIIRNAREQIDAVVDSLPEELQTWAQGEAEALNGELDQLQGQVQQTQQDFTRDLCDRAAGAVQEVREEVHAKREAAKGIIGRIADAIKRFAEDPFKFIVDGLLSLAGIDPGAFWALVDRLGDVVQAIADDPIGFCSTLLGAVGQGFEQFFGNITTHLGNGFFEWITGGLSSVGVQIPSDFSLGSIVTLCLQVMGLTWDGIKGVLAKHIGEENVELLEEAGKFLATFIQQGPAGLFELLKDHFDPSMLIQMVKDAAIQWLVEKVVQQAVIKIASMLNPAGAIVQAVMAIYKAVTWLFDNAAKIFKVVETIVNGAADLIAGNTAGLAGSIEMALAGMIAPAIDFVAGLIGLGDLPQKIAGVIKKLQGWVLGVVDKAIGWVAKHVRGLLKKLGGGEDDEQDEEGEHGEHATIAKSAAKELKALEPEPEEDYTTFRARVEQEATAIERRYDPQLEEQVHLKVIFTDPGKDAGDNDVDFTVRIAPNDYTLEDAIAGAFTKDAGAIVDGDDNPIPEDELARDLIGSYSKVAGQTHRVLVDGEARAMPFEGHHVPPKGLLKWFKRSAEQLIQQQEWPEENGEAIYPDELDTLANVKESDLRGDTLPAISINQATHRVKEPSISDPDFRAHWGVKTMQAVAGRLESNKEWGQYFIPIYRSKKPELEDDPTSKQAWRQLVDEMIARAREDGTRLSREQAEEQLSASFSENQLSSQLFMTELDLALKEALPQAEQDATYDVEQWMSSMTRIAESAHVQTLEACRVAVRASKVDGTEEQRRYVLTEFERAAAGGWDDIAIKFWK